MLAAVTNLAEYTVTELAFALKRTVEDAYGLLRVRGELSGFKRAASGHLYFTLKDDKACIDAVAWRGSVPKLAFEPADGLEVICTGRLTTYPGRSKYQLVVERIEPAGVGALMALLEERRKALAAEGLFDAARKRPLPYLPEVVGVVTSPTGAVIRDILHRLADRFPRRVIVWPVLVQGEGAAAQIAAAIRGFGDTARRWRRAAPGRADRRARRRVDRGSLGVQRGDRGPGGGGLHDPADLGRRPRDRHHADRPRRRPPRAHSHRRRRDGRAGAARSGAADRRSRRQAGPRRGAARLDQLRQRVDGLARGLPRPEMLLGLAAQRLDDLGERLRLRSPSELVQAQQERLSTRYARLAELAGRPPAPQHHRSRPPRAPGWCPS